MNAEERQQALALVALFECCASVSDWAEEGQDTADWVPFLKTLELEAGDWEALCPPLTQMERGLQAVKSFVKRDSRSLLIGRYAMQCCHLARRLPKYPQTLSALRERLQLLPSKIEYFGANHDNIVSFLAETYAQCISPLGQKIMVQGEIRYLQQDAVVAQIRMRLFMAVRAAAWWQALGGSRWQFLIAPSRLAQRFDALS